MRSRGIPCRPAGGGSPVLVSGGSDRSAGFWLGNRTRRGFDLEAGSLEAHLQRQRISVKPVESARQRWPTAPGSAPAIAWQSPVLEMDPGLLIDKVQITSEMCHGWLKYLAPLLANATPGRGALFAGAWMTRVCHSATPESRGSERYVVHTLRPRGPGPADSATVEPGRPDPGRSWTRLGRRPAVWHPGARMGSCCPNNACPSVSSVDASGTKT